MTEDGSENLKQIITKLKENQGKKRKSQIQDSSVDFGNKRNSERTIETTGVENCSTTSTRGEATIEERRRRSQLQYMEIRQSLPTLGDEFQSALNVPTKKRSDTINERISFDLREKIENDKKKKKKPFSIFGSLSLKKQNKKVEEKPTPEELLKQSLQQIKSDLQDMYPVFNVELEEIMKRPKEKKVPRVYRRLCEYIKEEGILIEGIFRLSGTTENMSEIQYIFDSLGDADLSLCQDVHTATSLLKQFLRDLPTPLIPYELFNDYIAILDIEDEDVKIKTIKSCLQKLKPCNRNCLGLLLDLLFEISKYSNKNMMTTRNLSVVMGVNCLRMDSDDPILFMTYSPKINSTFLEILDNFPKIKSEFSEILK
eukprot:gene8864-813_t